MTLHTPPEKIGPVVTLTFEEAKALLLRAQSAKGKDYVYKQIVVNEEGDKGCVYFDDDGCPSCKVGHVLHYKGVTREDLVKKEQNVGTDVDNLVLEGLLKVDLRTQGLLVLVQEFQDEGMPWGVAMDQALDQVDEWVAEREAEIEDDLGDWDGPF